MLLETPTLKPCNRISSIVESHDFQCLPGDEATRQMKARSEITCAMLSVVEFGFAKIETCVPHLFATGIRFR